MLNRFGIKLVEHPRFEYTDQGVIVNHEFTLGEVCRLRILENLPSVCVWSGGKFSWISLDNSDEMLVPAFKWDQNEETLNLLKHALREVVVASIEKTDTTYDIIIHVLKRGNDLGLVGYAEEVPTYERKKTEVYGQTEAMELLLETKCSLQSPTLKT